MPAAWTATRIFTGAILPPGRKPVTTGEEQLAGATAVAAEGFTGRGRVRVFGEEWAAVSALPVSAGQRVIIERVEGLLLHVRPQD